MKRARCTRCGQETAYLVVRLCLPCIDTHVLSLRTTQVSYKESSR